VAQDAVSGRDPVDDGLTRDQVAEVLRRAAELDAAEVRHAVLPELVDRSIVEEAAVEAGLSRQAVRQALVESATGAPPALLDRTRGRIRTDQVTVVRTVPGPTAEVRGLVERSLRRQVLVQQRIFDNGSRWTPRRGVIGTMRRNIDPSGKRGLKARVVEVRIADDPTRARERTVVRFDLDVRNVRHRETFRAVGGASVGALTAGALVGLNGLEAALFAVPLGGGIAAVGVVGGRLAAQRTMERIDVAVNRLLDRIEHRGQDSRAALRRGSAERALAQAEARVQRHLSRVDRRRGGGSTPSSSSSVDVPPADSGGSPTDD
jgi:hypothetical protein